MLIPMGPSIELATKSYSGDFDVCSVLCERVDRLVIPYIDLDAFVASVEPEHVLCLMQSTFTGGLESRRQIFDYVTNTATSQDKETNR